MSPRVREASVHPRLQSVAVVRPLNFTVRFRMSRSQIIFAALAVVTSTALFAQTEVTVTVRVALQFCVAENVSVSCSDVRTTLRELRTPPEAHINFSVDKDARYEDVSAALGSIRDAGFKLKLGYVNVQPH